MQMRQTGIGIDLVEIDRIRTAVSRWGERFLQRVYTEQELAQYRNKMESLAARFAGKEAVVKALSWPDRGYVAWKEIEILSDENGKPIVNLYGKALRLARESGIKRLVISLSHTRDNAVAMVLSTSGS
jgi:holo-[acyl-carrier protein] synthase